MLNLIIYLNLVVSLKIYSEFLTSDKDDQDMTDLENKNLSISWFSRSAKMYSCLVPLSISNVY